MNKDQQIEKLEAEVKRLKEENTNLTVAVKNLSQIISNDRISETLIPNDSMIQDLNDTMEKLNAFDKDKNDEFKMKMDRARSAFGSKKFNL